jgi:hypothetical protein
MAQGPRREEAMTIRQKLIKSVNSPLTTRGIGAMIDTPVEPV